VIVDASVVVKWFVVEDLHPEARQLLSGSEPLLAPDLVATEVANALWVKVGRGEMDETAAVRAIAAVSGRGEPEIRPSPPLARRAFDLARALDHPVYDCVYLALAEELDVPLVTADARFATASEAAAEGRVRLLGSWSSPRPGEEPERPQGAADRV
jgi:predicted nucleic acid-binding protein